AILAISILVLAMGDAGAAIVGENLNRPHNFYLTSDKKSFEGSVTMFVITFICIAGSIWYFKLENIPTSIIGIGMATALFVTSWEALSSKGFDNLTVPLTAAFMLHYFLIPLPHHDPDQMLLGLFLCGMIAAVSFSLKFLTASGSIATFLLASIIFGIGGWQWTIPILVFFIASSVLSKFGKSKKQKFELMFEKNETRDEGQVAANGGVAGIIVLLWYIFPEQEKLFFIYIAAIAAATADTWGTEIGTLINQHPRSILTFRSVEPGTSGAVSIAGLIGGMIGASLVTFSVSILDAEKLSVSILIKIVIAGVIGSLVDSFLGAALQAQYKNEEGKITEKNFFEGKPTLLTRGIRWINNDVVNWACSLAGAVAMYALL
ncbi:MAG: DUF92 domain-containing protein, partial [Bacteroidota bacterium]|nr:DUF92 domain-containing protein [Bacteroidota bacterium]